MACPRCSLRLAHPSIRINFTIPVRRAFHSTSRRQRLGAATYQQEWQTGVYHYNKQTSKNFPVVAQNVNKLLKAYATMRPSSGKGPAAERSANTSHRRGMEQIFISGSTAKDFGDKVVVDAFVYDSVAALEAQKVARMAARTGAKPAARSAGRSGPRRPPGGGGAGAGGAPRRAMGRPPAGFRPRPAAGPQGARPPRQMSGAGPARNQGSGEISFRKLDLGQSRNPGPGPSRTGSQGLPPRTGSGGS